MHDDHDFRPIRACAGTTRALVVAACGGGGGGWNSAPVNGDMHRRPSHADRSRGATDPGGACHFRRRDRRRRSRLSRTVSMADDGGMVAAALPSATTTAMAGWTCICAGRMPAEQTVRKSQPGWQLRFSDVAVDAGVTGDVSDKASGPAFVDYDGDDDLDLFVGSVENTAVACFQ